MAEYTCTFYKQCSSSNKHLHVKPGRKLTAESMKDETYPMYVGILAIIAIFALFVFYKRECMKILPVIAETDLLNEHEFNIH